MLYLVEEGGVGNVGSDTSLVWRTHYLSIPRLCNVQDCEGLGHERENLDS